MWIFEIIFKIVILVVMVILCIHFQKKEECEKMYIVMQLMSFILGMLDIFAYCFFHASIAQFVVGCILLLQHVYVEIKSFIIDNFD